MKLTPSLTHKVALWLLINLAVLAAAGAGFMVFRYGYGWNALVDGPAGERVRNVATLFSGELRSDPNQSIDALLTTYQPTKAARLTLFLNDEKQIGGAPVELPATVAAELTRSGPASQPPPLTGQPERGRRRPLGLFFSHSSEPSTYWIGARIPVHLPGSFGPSRGTLLISVPSALDLLLLLEFGPWFAAVGVAFLLSVLCWLPFVTSLRRDLLALTRATEHLAEGRFDTRVPATRRDELGTLGTAVNRMAERLDLHAQGQKRFLGDVAHELGSPLARLQVAVELLERRAAPELHPAITDVREEVQQIGTLVNELLAFTKAGLRPRAAELQTVELNPLLTEIIEREGATGRVELGLVGRQFVRADALLLNRAVGNLVRNALRYGGTSGAITVKVASNSDAVLLTVTDEGPGVPKEALPRLGEPFFRPETARSRETGGVGLGLAIVRSAVTACGGSVRFFNRTPRGFGAEITLAAA